MQPLPLRLSLAIRTAFQTAKPTPRFTRPPCPVTEARRLFPRSCLSSRIGAQAQLRSFSSRKDDIDRKIEDAKNRIDESIESKADHVSSKETKPTQELGDESIVHTHPEAASIVEPNTKPEDAAGSSASSSASTGPTPGQQPSSTPKQHSLAQRFSHIMDNLQSNIFVASRRLNDLTGYSEIEDLKNEITKQESLVFSSRKAVKDNRDKYSEAIATRSTTQREVNDLLHRKHQWSPSDLERFTALYRNDHANEQVEAAAQTELGRAESAYEEASTKLARTILARYHEEQIWSDKIRQMSTWGTWGLMGLNVLLFIVFQIAIEPWRRRRLVSGFEEKVEQALKDVSKAGSGDLTVIVPETHANDVAEGLANAIADAVTGASDPTTVAPAPQSQAAVEEAVERVIGSELPPDSLAEQEEDLSFPKPVIGEPSIGATDFATPSSAAGYAYYEEAFRELFSEKRVVVTQKELTTVALEGAAGGAALMGLLLVLFRPR